MKINIVVTDVVNDVKSVDTHVVITLLLHLVIYWKTATSYDKTGVCRGIPIFLIFAQNKLCVHVRTASPYRNVSAENFVRISVYCMGKFS